MGLSGANRPIENYPNRRIGLTAVSLNQTPIDWRGNRRRILAAIAEVARRSEARHDEPMAQIILTPELSLCGYGCEDAFHSRDLTHRAAAELLRLAEESATILPQAVILVGLPLRRHETTFNCMALLQGGRIVGVVPKRHLPGDGVHYEQRWFTPWRDRDGHSLIELPGLDELVPIGELLFSLGGCHFMVEICEDSWMVERPARNYLNCGLDLVLNPSASHFAFGKFALRRNIAIESSRALQAAFLSVNLLGCEAGRMIYDGSAILAQGGELLGEGGRFSFADLQLFEYELSLESMRIARGRSVSFRNQQEGWAIRSPIREIDLDTAAIPPRQQLAAVGSECDHSSEAGVVAIATERILYGEGFRLAADGEAAKADEFLHAVTLALFDYLRKSRSRAYVVSLSGGVDSAACALLVERMARISSRELGEKRARLRLLHNESSGEAPLLYTLYQATANSGESTRSAAESLARVLGSCHYQLDIEAIQQEYIQRFAEASGRRLNWQDDDLTLQNIQARARSPMAWLVANSVGGILLTTSNRSEAAVGYCTMDGDTSGGLAPIAGIDKAWLRRWLDRMEHLGDSICGPLPELAAVNQQAPTAELRPASMAQSDESDLMSYQLLDRIERLAVRDRASPLSIYRQLRRELSDFDRDEICRGIERYFTLWSRNQWKRERYAPSFHLDDEGLDPRTWYRFPILSGGYREELEELRAAFDAGE